MDRKTVVILGAGISGLSAGIYALQNGFDTILLEKNPSVGGFCTGWYRKGRYLDGCIHWLTGSKEGSDLYKMWQNVHAFKNKDDLFYLDNFGSFEYDGQVVTLWKDTYRAEKEWIALSPTDKKQIKHFFKMVRDVASVDCPTETPAMHLPFKRILRAGYEVMKVWPSYLLTMKMTCHGYAKKFKSKAIQNAIIHAQPGPGNLFSMLFCYGTIVKGDGAIPYGGSKAMSERMKDYFLSLGGSLKLNSFAKEIVVKDKKAIGVLLKNGELIKGDYIVPAISSEAVFRKLLNDQYHLSSFERRLGDEKRGILSYVLEDAQDLTQREREIISSLQNSVNGVFELKKITPDEFTMYNLINEKTYYAKPLEKFSKFSNISLSFFNSLILSSFIFNSSSKSGKISDPDFVINLF